MYFKDAHYNVGEMHLKNGIIYNEKADGRIGKLTVEYVKDTFENYYSSHSFGVNPGAICGGSNILLGIPGIRNQKEFSVHESHVESGMHIKENHVVIGEKIEIKPELENQEHLKVRDTAPISSIGSIMAGVQEIKENWEAIQKPHHHDIIIDAEPVENEVIAEAAKEEKTQVIAVDAEPKTPEKQGDFSLRQDELHEIIDEIYDEDIAPYHEFERAGSPDRVETELTRAVGKVQDVASGLANASDFSNMPDPIIGADSDPQSMVALGKGVMKVAEFAGEIFGAVIEPAANAIGTKVRRVLRDDLSVSQAKAQDIGDITHVVAGILIPGGTAKVISKTGKLTSFGKAAKEAAVLDYGLKWGTWDSYPKEIINGISYAKIGDRLYTEHAVCRMLPSGLGRNVMATKEGMSFPPNYVEHVIRYGTKTDIVMRNGTHRVKYSLGTAEVYTENNGKLIVTVNALRGKK